jgi:outer membrane protein assembly factor BamE
MKPTCPQLSVMRSRLAMLFAVCILSACADIPLPGVYRIDIQQGNVISQEQLAVLEAGMEKRKVRFILGTPLVTDVFNQQRWDYYYSLEQRGEDRVQRIVSVFFDGDRLSHIAGDVRAAAGPITLPERVDTVVTVPDGYRDEGIFASLTPSFISGKPKRLPSDDKTSSAEEEANRPAAEASAAPTSSTQSTASATPASPATVPTAAQARKDVEINAQDESYLRDLLEGFGSEGAAQTDAPASSESAANADTEEESLLSRWSKRLGWNDKPAPTTEQSDTNASPAPVQ